MKKRNLAFACLSLGLASFVISCGPQKKQEEPNKEEGFPAFDLANMDTTVAPCHDFFQYTGGGWIANNPIPSTESRWGQFNILIEENNKKLKGILEELSQKKGLKKGTQEQQIGDLYHSVMDSSKIEKDGLTHLQPFLDELASVSSKEDLLKLLPKYQFDGVSRMFGFYVSPDSRNSNRNMLHNTQSGLGLPDRDYYLKEDESSVEIQTKYKAHVANMFTLLGKTADEANAIAATVFNVEKDMAGLMMSRVERRNPIATYNKMSAQELNDLAPNLNINGYVAALGVAPDSIIVGQPEYIKNLGNLYSTLSLEDWKTYLSWKVVDSKADQLPHAFVQANFDFYSGTLRGIKEMKPRWKRALGVVSGSLQEQLGRMFAKQYFPEGSKKKVEQMVENIREAYRDRINGLEWMSSETKGKAIEKLNSFTYKIGYPNKWEDISGLDISADSYFQNSLSISRYGMKDNLADLTKPVDKDEWFMGAHVVNAYYNPLYNEIVFPAGILQPPFYNPEADDAINYGAIGGVIGHEFTHGFDDQGSKYGADGNLSDWWTAEDREKFNALAGRMVEQYSAYSPLDSVNVNGQLTLGENIADHGGLTLAYYAFKKSIDGKPEPAKVDGFSWNQRIFMGWAQVWQTNSTDKALRVQVMTDPHSPGKYRVVGPMSNMREFEEAWGCAGEMSRSDEDKIVIW